MKHRTTPEAFLRRLSERAAELAAIHGPEGMEVRIGDFQDGQTYGVGARFPGPMMHGVKIWPWHEHKPKPEVYAWECVTKLIAWWRPKNA
jgi:hypothetical protein